MKHVPVHNRLSDLPQSVASNSNRPSMQLEIKLRCGRCDASLPANADARVCSYGCTFCPPCTSDLRGICPNCGGELLPRTRPLTGHLLKSVSSSEPRLEERTLVIKTRGRFVFLDPDEIDWIEAAANYVKVIAGKVSYLSRGQIGRFAERLDPARFVRIHRSTIVNVRRIKELQPCENGEYIAVLKTGKELSCGRSYRAQLRKLFAGKL